MARTMLCLCMLLVALDASAEKTAFACQTIENGGFKWQNGDWELMRFKDEKFILVQDGVVLTSESVAAVMDTPAVLVSCFRVWGAPQLAEVSRCTSTLGQTLLFNAKTMEGGFSRILGAAVYDLPSRDSMMVAAFKCTKF